nr:MAG TPA: hypothetical protein [Caudoviricetes sp.]
MPGAVAATCGAGCRRVFKTSTSQTLRTCNGARRGLTGRRIEPILIYRKGVQQ